MKRIIIILFVVLPFLGFGQSDVGIINVLAPSGSVCDSSQVNPVVELKNYGTDTVISVDIYYNIDGATEYLYQWTGNLIPGATEVINLQSMITSIGVHNFQAYTSYPNFGQDVDISNDLYNSAFTLTGTYGIIPGAGTVGKAVTCPGKQIIISAYGGISYNWLGAVTGNTQNDSVAVTVNEKTTFYVEIIGLNCKQLDSVEVNINLGDCEYGVISNNVFSPNDDGVNDGFVFDIPQLIQYNNKVTIYNKWGDIIQEFTNYNNDDVIWKGKDKSGVILNNGTYFYVIEIKEINYSNSGWIQLIK